jgi:hypothetical protein
VPGDILADGLAQQRRHERRRLEDTVSCLVNGIEQVRCTGHVWHVRDMGFPIGTARLGGSPNLEHQPSALAFINDEGSTWAAAAHGVPRSAIKNCVAGRLGDITKLNQYIIRISGMLWSPLLKRVLMVLHKQCPRGHVSFQF